MLLIHRSDAVAFSVVSVIYRTEVPGPLGQLIASNTIKIPNFWKPEARKIVKFV